MTGEPSRRSGRWHREPLVWLVLAIPAASVIMGAVMLVLAKRDVGRSRRRRLLPAGVADRPRARARRAGRPPRSRGHPRVPGAGGRRGPRARRGRDPGGRPADPRILPRRARGGRRAGRRGPGRGRGVARGRPGARAREVVRRAQQRALAPRRAGVDAGRAARVRTSPSCTSAGNEAVVTAVLRSSSPPPSVPCVNLTCEVVNAVLKNRWADYPWVTGSG